MCWMGKRNLSSRGLHFRDERVLKNVNWPRAHWAFLNEMATVDNLTALKFHVLLSIWTKQSVSYKITRMILQCSCIIFIHIIIQVAMRLKEGDITSLRIISCTFLVASTVTLFLSLLELRFKLVG